MTNPCECEADGYCPRYGREMRGRFREICRGKDIDLGTAAAFREQWSREAPAKKYSGSPTKLILKTDQQPGDTVVLTAAIYSLHRSHPGKYITAVQSPYPEVFANNPDVVDGPLLGATELYMHYPAIQSCNDRGIHFMQGWTEFLGMAVSEQIPLLTDRPRLYFNSSDPPIENYWIVCSGGKRDFTNKLWGHHNYQEVVSSLKGAVRFVQVGSAEHDHPRLDGAEYMVGKTTLRQLFEWVRRARGVLCGVSLLMHVAAAVDRPAVVIAGGREPVAWNAYPKQQYVHTIGSLPCRSAQGHVGRACWRARVSTLGDLSPYDSDTCERPVFGLPQCMTMIHPEEVSALIARYNHG